MLIIMDLDQTLLREDRSISENTVALFDKLKSLGHYICFNSARSFDSMKPYIDLVNPSYIIANAGSQIYDENHNLIYKKAIDKKITKEIIESLVNKVDSVSIETDDGYFSNNYSYTQAVSRAIYKDLSIDNFYDSYKILYPAKDNKFDLIIEEKYNLNTSFYIGGTWHRISPSSKEEGNKKLKELLNNSEKTICFGDDLGDIGMLEEADIGVAMFNSQKAVLEKIKITTKFSNDEDGIYHFLKEYFNI